MVWNNAQDVKIGNSNVEKCILNGNEFWSKTSYRRVEYIQSTGTQYVITDMISTYDMRFEIDLALVERLPSSSWAPWFLFGYYEDDSSKPSHTVTTNTNAYSSDVYIGYNYQAYSAHGHLFHFMNAPFSSRNTLIVQKTGVCSWGTDIVNVSQIPQYNPTQPSYRFPILGYCHSGIYTPYKDYKASLYGFKVYRDQTLLHDFNPAERVSDGELGLLDSVTGKFYTNAGTGTFIKGSYI